jgi:hypothetical protein
MIDLPTSAEALFAAIPDEEAARAYLTKLRWPNGVRCSHCCSDRVVPLGTRPTLWSCRDCRGQTSLRAQTVLHGSRRPLREWLYVIWAVAHPVGATVMEATRFLGTRYATLFAMFQKVRAALAERAGFELAGDDVYVAFGWFRPGKLAKGDPRDRRNVLVAVTGKAWPGVPYSKELRASSLGEVFVPEQVLDDVLEQHVDPSTTAHLPDRAPMWGVINSEVDAVKRPFVHFLRWVRYRFTGVSRRYLGNYLAQYVYEANRRAERGDRMFDHVARRTMQERFRPAKLADLEPLVRRRPEQLAA